MSQKRSKTKNLRNVLVSPYNIHWSETNLEGVESLQKVLEKLLPLAKLENRSLKLHCKGKNNEENHLSTPLVQNNIFRSFLAPGFQSVIRGLEKNELCCVLLSSEISPPIIQRVVCSYCNTFNIPVVIIPQLKTVTKSTLGFPSMVLGLKKIAESPENKFFPIYEIVSQNRCVLQSPFTANEKKEQGPVKKEDCIVKTAVSSVKSEDVYLYRENRNDRVFRPRTGVGYQPPLPLKFGMEEDFISFNRGESKSLETGVKNMVSNSNSEDENDDSNCDSLDEDNIFFVDNNPDRMLLDEDPSNIEKGSALNPQANLKKDNTRKNVKTTNERYFLIQEKQGGNTKKFKSKEKDVLKQKPRDFVKANGGEKKGKMTSLAFQPLTIKTITNNPKKIRRKNK